MVITIKTNFTVIFFRKIIHRDQKKDEKLLCGIFMSLHFSKYGLFKVLSCFLFVISEKHLSFVEKKILQFVYTGVKLIKCIRMAVL